MNTYLITFSSGSPSWKNSKWKITAESRHEALHKANLIHDEIDKWDINMITLSKSGATGVSEVDFLDLDDDHAQNRIKYLESIWNNKLNKLENC